MASYYIQTSEGPRGPYSPEVIQQGVRDGRIPPTAQIQDAFTGQSVRASDVSADPAPQISGPVGPVPGSPYTARPAAPPSPYPQYGPQPVPGSQAAYTQYAAQPYGAQQQFTPYYPPRQTSGLAIASLVLTLTTLVSCLPTSIGGIICGALALKETGPGGAKDGRTMAQWGLWLGVALTGLYVLGAALFALAIAATP